MFDCTQYALLQSVFVWQNNTTSYFSVPLKFGAFYITGQPRGFRIKTLIYVFIYFFGILLLFFLMKFVFLLFSFLYSQSETRILSPKLLVELYVLALFKLKYYTTFTMQLHLVKTNFEATVICKQHENNM